MIKKDIPVIKLFIKNDCFYCYDASANAVFSFTQNQYEEAHKLIQMGITDYCNYALNSGNTAAHDILFLVNSGVYFEPELISKSEYPDLDILPFLYERGFNDSVLQVTRDCNFCCRYCQFASNNDISRKHEKQHMSLAIAKQAVDFIMNHSTDAYTINIAFYGGEPLLNIKLIREILEYTANTYPLKLISYNMTINASLLNDVNIKILKNYNVNLMISFDGPENVQNYNRKFKDNGGETFHIVFHNISKLRKKYKKYFDNYVTFHAVSLNHEQTALAEKFFNTEGISTDKYKVVFADLNGIDYIDYHNDVSHTSHLTMSDYNAEWYTNRLKCLNMKYKVPSKWQHSGPCVPGIRRLFVDIDGKFYLCEKAIENDGLSIGSLDNGIDVTSAKKLLNIGELTQEECKKCFAFRFCSICAANCIDPVEGRITTERKKTECENQRKLAIDFLREYVEYREGQ